jgi:hypothetical protein
MRVIRAAPVCAPITRNRSHGGGSLTVAIAAIEDEEHELEQPSQLAAASPERID